MDGTIVAAVIGAAIPVAGAIAGGFWRLSNKIHSETGNVKGLVDGVKKDVGEIKGDIKAINQHFTDFNQMCAQRHQEVDRRLGKLEDKHD